MKAILKEDQTIEIYPETVAEKVVLRMMNDEGGGHNYTNLMEDFMEDSDDEF